MKGLGSSIVRKKHKIFTLLCVCSVSLGSSGVKNKQPPPPPPVISPLKRIWNLSFPLSLANWFHTLALLKLKKNQQLLDQNYCPHQWTLQVKPPWVCSSGTCSWCLTHLYKNHHQNPPLKFALNVADGNSWRHWVVVTSLLSLACMALGHLKPVWWNEFLCPTLS